MRFSTGLMVLGTFCFLAACGGSGGSSGGAVLTITSIAPSQGSLAGGTPVTLTGTEFAAGATVTFGGSPATAVVVVNATTINCETPAGTGTVDVVVTVGANTATLPGAYAYVVVLTDADFTGTYQIVCFRGSVTNTDTAANVGFLVANGAGQADATLGENENTTYTAPAPGGTFGYAVQTDGNITVDTLSGGLSQDGSVAVLAATRAADDPMICVLLRRSGSGYSDATLGGSYHMAHIVGGSGATTVVGRWTNAALGPVVHDGTGGAAHPSIRENVNGTPSGTGGGGSSYAVAPDGTLTTGATWTGTGLGAVTSDGSFVCLAGSNETGPPPFAWFMTRAGSGLTNSVFSGEYWAIGISSDPGSTNNFTSFFGTVTADGAGGMNYVSTTENLEGVTSQDSGLDTYAVGATGTLTSGSDRVGGITTDGKFAFLGGAEATGGTPMLFLFVRK